jgi:hypothetical protein
MYSKYKKKQKNKFFFTVKINKQIIFTFIGFKLNDLEENSKRVNSKKNFLLNNFQINYR